MPYGLAYSPISGRHFLKWDSLFFDVLCPDRRVPKGHQESESVCESEEKSLCSSLSSDPQTPQTQRVPAESPGPPLGRVDVLV